MSQAELAKRINERPQLVQEYEKKKSNTVCFEGVAAQWRSMLLVIPVLFIVRFEDC